MSPFRVPEDTKVLVVDDDKVDRRTVKRLLDSQVSVLEASTEAEMKQVLAEHPEVQCIFLDYHIPGLESFSVLSELANQGFGVVMLTGLGNESVAVEAMKSGAIDYLSKDDLSQTTLLRTIVYVLETSDLKLKVKQRQEELEHFAHIAAHDLQAPVSRIKQCCELISGEIKEKLTEQQVKLFEISRRSCEQVTNLIGALLDYASLDKASEHKKPVDLNAVIGNVVLNLEHIIKEKLAEITYGNLPSVLGDEARLYQLFQNLVANSLKFQDKGDPPKIQIESSNNDTYTTICIKDNGIGIDPKHHEKIFKAFSRLHSSDEFPGHGLGLATCLRIVEQHNGKLEVDSRLGSGTTFKVSLPLYLDSA